MAVRSLIASNAVLGLCLLLTACAAPVRPPEARRGPGMHLGSSGAAWDAVLPGPLVSAAGLTPEYSPEFARRDAALSHRPNTAVVALDDWPQRARPDLDRARRFNMPRNADAVLYFDLEQPASRHHHHNDRRNDWPPYDRYRPGNHW